MYWLRGVVCVVLCTCEVECFVSKKNEKWDERPGIYTTSFCCDSYSIHGSPVALLGHQAEPKDRALPDLDWRQPRP
jgi:hypothetical protein